MYLKTSKRWLKCQSRTWLVASLHMSVQHHTATATHCNSLTDLISPNSTMLLQQFDYTSCAVCLRSVQVWMMQDEVATLKLLLSINYLSAKITTGNRSMWGLSRVTQHSVFFHFSNSALTSHHCWVSPGMYYQIYSHDCFCQKSLVLRGLVTILSLSSFHRTVSVLELPQDCWRKDILEQLVEWPPPLFQKNSFHCIPQAVMNLPLAQPALPVWAELDFWSVSSESA